MSISKILTLAALAAALVFIFGDVVENQERKIKGIVVQTPTGLNTTGRPVANARIEYMGDNSTGVQSTTTDSNGRFELPSGTSGIVTASKSGLTTISVGYIDSPNSTMPSSELRIELPRPATLSGRLYDMATRRNAGAGMLAVVVDHEVNPRSAADFVTNGQYKFDGLPPGSATLVAHAEGFAPNTKTVTLTAGGSKTADIGLLLDGTVSGTVVDASGNAVAEAYVHVAYDGFDGDALLLSFVGGHRVSDSDGQFFVNGIVPNEGFAVYAETEDGRRSPSMSLQATPGITIENVTLKLG